MRGHLRVDVLEDRGDAAVLRALGGGDGGVDLGAELDDERVVGRGVENAFALEDGDAGARAGRPRRERARGARARLHSSGSDVEALRRDLDERGALARRSAARPRRGRAARTASASAPSTRRAGDAVGDGAIGERDLLRLAPVVARAPKHARRLEHAREVERVVEVARLAAALVRTSRASRRRPCASSRPTRRRRPAGGARRRCRSRATTRTRLGSSGWSGVRVALAGVRRACRRPGGRRRRSGIPRTRAAAPLADARKDPVVARERPAWSRRSRPPRRCRRRGRRRVPRRWSSRSSGPRRAAPEPHVAVERACGVRADLARGTARAPSPLPSAAAREDIVG